MRSSTEMTPAERRKHEKLAELLAKAKDHVMSPAEIEAQRKSWVCGQMMLRYQTMTYDEASAFYDRAASTLPPSSDVAGGEPAAWLHPTAGWAHADYHQVRLHCFNDGPMPVPLYRAAATEADHG